MPLLYFVVHFNVLCLKQNILGMRRPACLTKTDWWTWGPRSLKYPPLVWRMTRETMLMTALMTFMMTWRRVILHLWPTLHSSLGTAPVSHRHQLAATQPRLPGIVFRNQWPRFVDYSNGTQLIENFISAAVYEFQMGSGHPLLSAAQLS